MGLHDQQVKNEFFLARHWRGTSEVVHAALAVAALALGFVLRFDFKLDPETFRVFVVSIPVLLAIKFAVFRYFGLRDLTWRYPGFRDLTQICAANGVASAAVVIGLRLLHGSTFPRSIYILDGLICLVLMVASRAVGRLYFDLRSANASEGIARRILIYGAGNAGATLLSEIHANPQIHYQVVGFIDDDPAKRNLRLNGVQVLGDRTQLSAIALQEHVEEVLLALPSATGEQITQILEQCHAAQVTTKKIPPLAELIEHRVLVDQIREVRVEDLLGRPPVQLEQGAIRSCLSGKVILVTGAGGSIGSELCRQIARFRPAALVGVDNAETALYNIDQEMREFFPDIAFYPEVGSVQSRWRLEEIFTQHRPDAVYHAAAYKHVPMMEAHPFEAVENNIFGTNNVARAAIYTGVEIFVLVSTDKAVRPTNIMGATKRIAELACQAAGATTSATRFIAVRFGNVLGSNGSVIPKFKRQIAAGGPVTVTHPEMRRFFMTIPEAAQLVLQAAAMGSGGEVFVLEMGDPVRIVDLARKMVLLSGFRPDEDIKIEFSGVRPGEKLYEELCTSDEDTVPTPHSQIRIFTGKEISPEVMASRLEELKRHVQTRDAAGIVLCLKDMVPDYNPSSYVLRRAFDATPKRAVAAGPISVPAVQASGARA